MAKIFQLELFIKEIAIWQLPDESEDCDETCVELNVFDQKEVPIHGYVFETNSTLNRGQSFLFTLAAMPAEEMASFQIFKKAFNREKKYLGGGIIPLEKIFNDIFVKTFNEVKESHPEAQFENVDSTSDNSIKDQAPQERSNSDSPISRITKDLYPIIGGDKKQWGSICILMRLTSFGNFSAHPIHIHQSHNQIILQNSPNQAMYKCIKVEDLKMNIQNSNNKRMVRKQQQPLNYTNNLAENNKVSCGHSNSDLCPCPPVSPSGTESDAYEEFRAEVNDNVLCVRMQKNTGIVRRVYDNNDTQSTRRDAQYYADSQNSSNIRNIPIIRGNNKYPAHYGIITTFPTKCDENNLIYDQRANTKDFSLQCTENRILQNDNISCPSDVQIIRKKDDPKRDVFVLKIGKGTYNGKQNEIHLEMKTPKNPYANHQLRKQTTSAQTYDEEFVSQVKKGAAEKGKEKGKKGGKKNKS